MATDPVQPVPAPVPPVPAPVRGVDWFVRMPTGGTVYAQPAD